MKKYGKFNPKFKIGDTIIWNTVSDKPRKILGICGDKKDGYQYNLQDFGWYNVESVDKTATKVMGAMKFRKGDKVVCIEEFDEHNSKGYGVNLGKMFTVTKTNTWTNQLQEKYQMLELDGPKKFKGWKINALHFRKATKLDGALK